MLWQLPNPSSSFKDLFTCWKVLRIFGNWIFAAASVWASWE
jgi:hypothetical protein